ncbi:unnamed protein product [Rotaria sp. Silwood2]|nr:unnamed protein product [Rotaria sp. Silwood2]CAF4550477.1 unnamed protein product [Rotaria sp. Silwood2]
MGSKNDSRLVINMYASMVILLSSRQIDVLLNSGLDEQLSVDEIIQKLSQFFFNSILNHLTHRFFALKFFPRVNPILQQWSNNDRTMLNKNDSTTLRHTSNLILQMSDSMNNQLENNKALLDTIKICLNNILSFGYYIMKSNQEEDFNLASFDCLVEAYGNIKCRALVEAISRCATSRFFEDALFGIRDLPLNNTEHFLLVICLDYVLKCDEENGKHAHFIFD